MSRAFPNPQPCHAITDPERAAKVRRLDCRTYNHCLSVIEREGAEGFSCTACRAFKLIDPEQRRVDQSRLVELLAESYRQASAKRRA